MSEINDLLNSLSDKPHIIINRDRTIIVPDALKKFAVQYDHNVGPVTFDCLRYLKGSPYNNIEGAADYDPAGRNKGTDFYKAVMEDGFNVCVCYTLPDGTQDEYIVSNGPNLLDFDSIMVEENTYKEISLTLTPGRRYHLSGAVSNSSAWGYISMDNVVDKSGSYINTGITFTAETETVTFRFHGDSGGMEFINLMLQEVNVWVDHDDPSIFHFKWTITDSFTYQAGEFTFLVCFKKANDDGETLYRLSTEICADCRIIPSMDPNPESPWSATE